MDSPKLPEPTIENFDEWWRSIPQDDLHEATFSMLKMWCSSAYRQGMEAGMERAAEICQQKWLSWDGPWSSAASDLEDRILNEAGNSK